MFDFFLCFYFFQKGFWILLFFNFSLFLFFFKRVFDSSFFYFSLFLFFFSKRFWFLFFFNFSFFLFFLQNYYHFTKGKEPARSPKPAVSFPLNPFLFGHGLGLCPKNLLALEVSSVSYEQIRVAIFFYHIMSSWTWFRISL